MAYAGTIQPRTHLATVLKSHKTLGLKAPAALEQAAADADATVKRLSGVVFRRDDLVRAVYAALADDKDPVEDPAVQREISRQHLTGLGIGQDLEALRNEAIVKAARPAVSAFLASWSRVIKDAQSTIDAARKQIPGANLSDPGAVVSLAPDDMATWGRAREGIARAQTVVTGWTALAALVGGPTVGRHSALVLAALTPAELRDMARKQAAAVHELDVSMSLATFEDFRARVEAVQDAQQAQAATRAAEQDAGPAGLSLYRMPARTA